MGIKELSLISLLLELRQDLRELAKKRGFLERWIIENGLNEYVAVNEDEGLLSYYQSKHSTYRTLTTLQYLIYQIRPDIKKLFDLRRELNLYINWFYRYGVKEHNLFNLLTLHERNFINHLNCRKSKAFKSKRIQDEPRTFIEKSFGVNLYGSVFGEFGLGEDVRMLGRSLESAKIPFNLINFSPINISSNDMSMQHHVNVNRDFAFNIFSMSPLEQGRLFLEQGSQVFKNCYNIAYWPWELKKWPKEWYQLFQYVDEIWVHTSYIHDSLKDISPVPIRILPPASNPTPIVNMSRKDFNLPDDVKLFCFSFDLNSSIFRKNPQACIDAFLLAFPKNLPRSQNVGLVIKTHRPVGKNLLWEKLKLLAKTDHRIYIIEKTLDRPSLLALYKLCDCFLSLHRAEGYGRGIAEAIQLGLHVITTNFSGNTDFCCSPQCSLINFKLLKVKKGEYPYFQKQVWASPDIKHAADEMKKFVDQSFPKSYKDCALILSPSKSGQLYLDRIQKLWKMKSIERIANSPFPRNNYVRNFN